MAENPWSNVGDSFDKGLTSGLNISRIKMEKQKMAQEAIKAKFEMMQKNYEHAWQVVKDPQIPGATKVNYWNHIIAPYDNQVMGMKTPEMTKWNDELQGHVEQAAHVMDLVADGKLSVKEGKLAYNHIQAEVASNPQASQAFKGIDATLSELSGQAPIDVNVGDKTVKAAKNINGTYDPVQVKGMGTGVAPSQLSQQTTKDRLDAFNATMGKFQEASKIVASSKDGSLEAVFPSLSPAEREQAVREAHSSLYILGGQIGLPAKQISGIIDGSLDSNKILSDVGKNFALPGTHMDTSGDVPVAKPLPGLSVTPKQVSQAPAMPDAPQMASAPAPVAPVSDVPQMSAAASDSTMPKDIANA